MTDTKAFLMASPDVLVAVGRVAVGGGVLEARAQDMLLALGTHPEKKSCAEVLRQIRRHIKDNALPTYAEVDGDTLDAWCDRASHAMNERNQVLHAALYLVAGERGWLLHSEHLRSATRRNLNDADGRDHLAKLAATFKSLADESHVLYRAMLREVRDCVYVKRRRHNDDSWIAIFHGDDPSIERPTDEELDHWWSAYGPF